MLGNYPKSQIISFPNTSMIPQVPGTAPGQTTLSVLTTAARAGPKLLEAGLLFHIQNKTLLNINKPQQTKTNCS